MSEEIIFRDDMSVELVKSSASDADVIWAARVSTAGDKSLEDVGADPAKSEGLINYLARERHGSPFEHTSMTFFISAPIFVFREFMRHRIASYNEESGRYRELKPVFYIPSKERSKSCFTSHFVFINVCHNECTSFDEFPITANSKGRIAFPFLPATGNRDGGRENGSTFCQINADYLRSISKIWPHSPLISR